MPITSKYTDQQVEDILSEVAAVLDKHGASSELPIPYIHIDIAGSGVEGGDWQHGKPTAASLASIYATFCN